MEFNNALQWTNSRSYLVVLGTICLVMLTSNIITTVEADGVPSPKPFTFPSTCPSYQTFTVFGQRTISPQAKATIVTSATPSGNLSITEFGTLEVEGQQPVTAKSDPKSTVIGSVADFQSFLKNPTQSLVLLTFTFFENFSFGSGSIAVSGIADYTPGAAFPLAVIGGTGNFESASGTLIASVFSITTYTVTFELTFKVFKCGCAVY